MDKQILCENEIQGIEFKLTLLLFIKVSKLEINGESVLIQDVDIAQTVRAIMTSHSVLSFASEITGVWNDDEIKQIISEIMKETAGVI